MNEILPIIADVLPFIAVIVSVSVGGWVITTWLRIKNGYPLETSWGQPLHPSNDKQALERIKLLTAKTPSCAPSLDRSRTGSRPSSGSSPTSPRGSPGRSILSASSREAAHDGAG